MTTLVKTVNDGPTMSECMLEAFRMAATDEVRVDPFGPELMPISMRGRIDYDIDCLAKDHRDKHKNHVLWYHGKRRY